MGEGERAGDDDFQVSGPTHMMSRDGAGHPRTVINWTNEEHRRCIAACLVKATCVMENDRIKCRMYNGEALAPLWWKSIGFKLLKAFINDSDENDQFTYGAIFQHIRPSPQYPSAPEYVVAFRGTMLCHPKAISDLFQDFLIFFNAVPNFTRFKIAHPDIGNLISSSASFWLAGHSLGATMALEIGRSMALERGCNIPTFLFNPPHVSLAPVINHVLTAEQKTALYMASFMLKFRIANLLPGYHTRMDLMFQQLAPWVPELYVNPNDTICRGFIDYFEQRQLVYQHYPDIAATGARSSYRDMFFMMFNNKVQPHLLPSARLWRSSSQEMGEAHLLRQWLKSDADLALSGACYRYEE